MPESRVASTEPFESRSESAGKSGLPMLCASIPPVPTCQKCPSGRCELVKVDRTLGVVGIEQAPFGLKVGPITPRECGRAERCPLTDDSECTDRVVLVRVPELRSGPDRPACRVREPRPPTRSISYLPAGRVRLSYAKSVEL